MNRLSLGHWAAAVALVAFFARAINAQESPEAPLRGAPPKPSPSEQAQVIEAARILAMQYTANLPNFICTQTIRRLQSPKGSKSWKAADTMTLDLGFSDGIERHKLLTINGKSTDKSFDKIEGATSKGEFGGTLAKIFRAESATTFRWERWTSLRGRPTHVFSYQVDQAHSDYYLSYELGGKRGNGLFPFEGLVYVDRERGQVTRLTSVAQGIPRDWPLTGFVSETDYGFAEISGQKFLLPLHAETIGTLGDGTRHRNVIEFSNYRKFSAEAILKFETR